MAATNRPLPRHPALLTARVTEADHLARAIRLLSGKATVGDPSYLWLLGRADEVRAFVDEIVREWGEGSIATAAACEAIRGYVGSVHVALHRRFGGYGAACCGPHLEPFPRKPSDAGARPVRARLESGVQGANDEAPASRVRSKLDTLTEPLGLNLPVRKAAG